MQTYDEAGKLLETRQLENAEELAKAVKSAMENPKVQHVAIGRIPRKGDSLVINGLRFDCVFVDAVHGIFKLKIRKPK